MFVALPPTAGGPVDVAQLVAFGEVDFLARLDFSKAEPLALGGGLEVEEVAVLEFGFDAAERVALEEGLQVDAAVAELGGVGGLARVLRFGAGESGDRDRDE